MPLKAVPRSLGTVAASVVVVMPLVACTTGSAPTEAPSPAMLAAVRKLAPHPCNASTAAVLDRMGMQPDHIRSVTYDRRIGTAKNILQGYDVWVQRTDQPGDLVVRLNRFCRSFASAGRS
jgi:hypothetical protein